MTNGLALDPGSRAAARGALHGRRTPAELALLVALAAAGYAAFVGLRVVVQWRSGLAPELGGWLPAWIAALALGALAAAAALVCVLVRGVPRAGALVACAWTLAVLVAAANVAAFPAPREPLLVGSAGLAGGFLALLVLASRARASRPRVALERLGFGLATSLVLAELALRAISALAAPAILQDEGSTLAWLRAQRLRPGTIRFGFPVNSRGDYDAEPPAPGTPHVVVIGDSFSVSAVPLPLHYTTVAEAALGMPVYNMGAPGISPPQYLELLVREALPLRPRAVVIALFVGNDLEFELPAAGGGLVRSFVDRERSVLARFVVRASRIAAESRRVREDGTVPGAAEGQDEALVDPARLAEVFPWTVDPALEKPAFSEAAFRAIERRRALDVARARPGGYRCFPFLEEMRRAAGDVPLVVLLVPDEFQVEDDVWAEVTARSEALDRERPQRELAEFCATRDIVLVDPLPALIAAAPLADGRRHVYHVRDTHWNARGNAIAGAVLADALRALFAR